MNSADYELFLVDTVSPVSSEGHWLQLTDGHGVPLFRGAHHETQRPCQGSEMLTLYTELHIWWSTARDVMTRVAVLL